ncbi:MAG: nitrilase-related carbon-nitrogen hydrolase [Rhodospirillaceae bacterium]|nr:nitrilase-related carbon-nitrogen hydrolase [Rhodospirillaceae bacterium]
MSDPNTTFTATALQIDCHAVNGCADRAESSAQMLKQIESMGAAIKTIDLFTMGFNGTKTKLFVLPEYFLSSFPMGEPIARWQEIGSIPMDGPEYEALGKIAQSNNCFLSGNVYEIDPNFSELYFQTCFVIGSSGDVVLRYRRLISQFAPGPYDVLDKYLDLYGAEAIFPVADTEIGKIGCVASEEILYPEISRCLAMRGMEILCHSTSEVGAPMLTPKEICRRARAVENMCYVVSSNTASIKGTPIPAESTGGMSKIVDYKGLVLAEAYTGETFCASAMLDMDSLRKVRKHSGMTNLLSRQPFDLYAQQYGRHTFVEPNGMLENGEVKVPGRAFFVQRQQEVLERLGKEGILS